MIRIFLSFVCLRSSSNLATGSRHLKLQPARKHQCGGVIHLFQPEATNVRMVAYRTCNTKSTPSSLLAEDHMYILVTLWMEQNARQLLALRE